MRYGIYYTPDRDHPLSQCVKHWLGRSAFNDEEFPTSHGCEAFIASPRRYGFHGTLKAPFHLAENVREEELVELFESFAETHTAFSIDRLVLGKLGPFFALVPEHPSLALENLAAGAVRTFEPMRAPLSQRDIERRNPASLSPRQRQYLERWGYPYVLDEFRFHLTLTGPVEDSESDRVEAAIREHFSDFLDQPLAVETIGIFMEPQRGDPFTALRIAALAAETR